MNKLEVALKLFHLLNERKKINSKIVADELNVSLRTAQRYLLELSILPCVCIHEDKRTYSLNDGYRLKGGLASNNSDGQILHKIDQVINEALEICELFCLKCLELDRSQLQRIGMNVDGMCNDSIHKLRTLQAVVRRMVEENRCVPGKNVLAGRDSAGRCEPGTDEYT